MSDRLRGDQDLVELIGHYSPTLDLVDAVNNARESSFEALTGLGEMTISMVKVLIDSTVQARLDVLTALVVSSLAQAGDWKIDIYDQERKALKDAMLLVKYHLETELYQAFADKDEEDDDE